MTRALRTENAHRRCGPGHGGHQACARARAHTRTRRVRRGVGAQERKRRTKAIGAAQRVSDTVKRARGGKGALVKVDWRVVRVQARAAVVAAALAVQTSRAQSAHHAQKHLRCAARRQSHTRVRAARGGFFCAAAPDCTSSCRDPALPRAPRGCVSCFAAITHVRRAPPIATTGRDARARRACTGDGGNAP